MNGLRQQGFTLVEMIIVIVISGIMLGLSSVFIATPIQGFIDLSRRATLVYSAENALRRMQRDIRRALPNSVRVNGNAIELISIVEGARYHYQGGPADGRLQFNIADTDFDVFGNLSNLGSPSGLRIAIYNIGAIDAGAPKDGSNAYAGPDLVTGTNVITPEGTVVNITDNGDEDHIQIVDGWQFSHESQSKRLYLVNHAISYVCSGGELRRYTYTDFTYDSQPVSAADFTTRGAGSGDLMASNVSACSFSYADGTDKRSGVTTLDITIKDASDSEQINLLHQVHVDNAP